MSAVLILGLSVPQNSLGTCEHCSDICSGAIVFQPLQLFRYMYAVGILLSMFHERIQLA